MDLFSGGVDIALFLLMYTDLNACLEREWDSNTNDLKF